MALIDEISKTDDQKENQLPKCNTCKISSKNVNPEINICEACFNTQLNDALKKIDENIYSINEEMKKFHHFVLELEKIMNNSSLSLIVHNKTEIDLINAKSTLLKLQIDLDANQSAYYINQRQANAFRKLSNWELFEINNKYKVKTEDK